MRISRSFEEILMENSDEKGSKRYSARTRPEHWGTRQSPSPINDQNFNDHLNVPPQEDPLQDALGEIVIHFSK